MPRVCQINDHATFKHLQITEERLLTFPCSLANNSSQRGNFVVIYIQGTYMPLKSATAINSHAEGKNASVDVIVNILEARIGVATGASVSCTSFARDCFEIEGKYS